MIGSARRTLSGPTAVTTICIAKSSKFQGPSAKQTITNQTNKTKKNSIVSLFSFSLAFCFLSICLALDTWNLALLPKITSAANIDQRSIHKPGGIANQERDDARYLPCQTIPAEGCFAAVLFHPLGRRELFVMPRLDHA